MVQFVEYAPPRGDPISFGPTCVRLDHRLCSDTLQHLPVAARLPVGHIYRIRPYVLRRQRVVFLRRHVRRAHVQAGDRGGPVSERGVIPGPFDVWFPLLRISALGPQETSQKGEGRQQSSCELRLRAHVRSMQGFARRVRKLCTTLRRMAMGKRTRDRQPAMCVTTTDLPTAASHPFYCHLNRLLREHGFDEFAEAQCTTFTRRRWAGRAF